MALSWDNLLLPGEGDVPTGDFFQVVYWRRLASEAIVGVVVGHDGGGPQLTELAVRALKLQLYRLQLRVLPPVHCKCKRIEKKTKQNRKFIGLLRIPLFQNKTRPLPHLPPQLFLLRSTTCTTAVLKINRIPLCPWNIYSFLFDAGFVKLKYSRRVAELKPWCMQNADFGPVFTADIKQ